MTHDQMSARLNDHLDGDLSPAERSEVEVHLGSCEPCRQELAALQRLKAETARLARDVAPPRDLWPRLESSLSGGLRPAAGRSERAVGGWLLGLAAAAAVILLVLLRAPGDPVTVAGPEATPVSRGTALAEVEAAEREYQAAAAKLSAALARNQELLPDDARLAIEQSLTVIETALADARAELQRDPGNVRVALMFTTLHQEKVALLRAATRIAGSSEKG